MAMPAFDQLRLVARILLIDDDPALARLCRFLLSLEGHDVAYAAHGQQAIALLDEQGFDLIVLDLEMPVMDGRTFFRLIQARPSRPPVMLLTIYESKRTQRELGTKGALDKPFTPEAFLAEISFLLTNGPAIGATS
jgi:CheY-like chemotaxis protein